MLESTSTDRDEVLRQHLIMEIIRPPTISVPMLRQGKLAIREAVTELGIFSTVFIDTTSASSVQDSAYNKVIGLLMRTKGMECNEGGVNSGYAVID